jgi:hypothetical protein
LNGILDGILQPFLRASKFGTEIVFCELDLEFVLKTKLPVRRQRGEFIIEEPKSEDPM